ncbi:MAG: hypothetical protein SGILL_004161 [Bacillariaceae sp.]
MVHSSEANAGYILNPPKPRRRRRASDGTPITPNPASPGELSSSVPHASAIGFKTSISPPSLRSITKGKNRVERFDYAKALLRSDEELEKLSTRIRKEINESELFELALAAERAADAGEEKFAGRASTFGGEQQQNHHKYQPMSKPSTQEAGATLNSNKKDQRNVSTRTFSTVSTTTIGTSASYIGRPDDGTPTIGMTPNTPDKLTMTEKTRYPSSPGLILSASEPSLLETMVDIASSVPEEPAKKSMGVDSLRDINEVIPHWNELHQQMRTHLFRQSVNETTLIFDPQEIQQEQTSFISTEPLKIAGESSPSTPKHRRSRSFLESIADIAVPRFGQSDRKRRHQVRSAGSFDFMSILSTDDKSAPEEVASDESIALPPDQRPQKHVLSSGLPCPNEGVRKDSETESLALREKEETHTFDLTDVSNVIEAENTHPPKNRSACSSETTSVASSSSGTHAHDAAQNSNIVEFQARDIESGNGSSAAGNRIPTKAEVSAADDRLVTSTSLIDNDDASSAPSDSHQPIATDRSNPTPPLTPNDSAVISTRDLGFNTPAHLRVIKGIQKNSRLNEKLVDAPKQPQLMGTSKSQEVAVTPSLGFNPTFEPNSIIDNTTNVHQEARFPERSKASLEEVETRFLSLPAITGSASDSSLRRLPTRRITRRKVERSQWLDSPTTPTDQIGRSFLSAPKQQEICVLDKATSHDYYQKMCNNAPRDAQTITRRPSEENDALAVLTSHSDFVVLVSNSSATEKVSFPTTLGPRNRFDPSLAEYKEEKKECEDVLPARSENDTISLPGTFGRESDSSPQHRRILIKSMSSPQEACREDNSVLERSFNTATSAPSSQNHSEERSNTYILKRTNTWDGVDGVVSGKPVGAIGAVNSLISTTSAAVTDAADFFSDTIKRESKDADESMCESSAYTKDQSGSAKTMISRLGVGHTLCNGEENFRAAVQGVLSHLSLSPRARSHDSEICEILLPESENKEFLRNYFYCTNQQDEDGKTEEAVDANAPRKDRSSDNLDSTSQSEQGLGGRIACAAEPCSAHDTTCTMLGVDSVCNGVTYFLFAHGTNDFDGSAGTHYSSGAARKRGSADLAGNDAGAIPTQGRHGSRPASFNNDNIGPAPGTPRRGGIDLQNQPAMDSGNPIHSYPRYSVVGIADSRESWLGMFQRVASERLFNGENGGDMEKSSKHSFTPPCLTRRVLIRNQTK